MEVGDRLEPGDDVGTFQQDHCDVDRNAGAGDQEGVAALGHGAHVCDQGGIDDGEIGGLDAPQGIDDSRIAYDFKQIDEDGKPGEPAAGPDAFQNPEGRGVDGDKVKYSQAHPHEMVGRDYIHQVGRQGEQPHDQAGTRPQQGGLGKPLVDLSVIFRGVRNWPPESIADHAASPQQSF